MLSIPRVPISFMTRQGTLKNMGVYKETIEIADLYAIPHIMACF